MSRTALFLAAASLLAAGAFALAQETAPGPNARRPSAARGDQPPARTDALPTRAEPPGPPPQPPIDVDVRAIRQMLEQQSKQLDALAREIAQLSLQVAAERKASADLAARTAAAAGVPAPPPPAEVPAAPPADAQPAAEPPKAEAVAGPNGAGKHTVAKGETLTSIAKEYNIPLADLQKANKIPDVRKLQIGQILNVPTSKTPESSTDKKEKP
ncbi:MAG TPA: LysM domain-containing protein [Chthoniobacteraceae bacterium]